MTKNHKLFDVQDKIACVTGASSGLGRAAATFLAQQGAKVIGVARRKQELIEWQKIAGETAIVVADLNDRSSLPSVADAVKQCFGDPEILINAAGINTRQTADSVTPESWDKTINLNLSVPFFLAQSFAITMQKNNWGRIVNFASLQSQRAFYGGIAYGASKGGVVQLTRAMAEAWSSSGIMTNAIAPGFFPTELTQPVFSDVTIAERNAHQTCIGRNGEISDLYGPLLFLCSDASAYVTGQTLYVDGGFSAK